MGWKVDRTYRRNRGAQGQEGESLDLEVQRFRAVPGLRLEVPCLTCISPHDSSGFITAVTDLGPPASYLCPRFIGQWFVLLLA